MEQSNHRSREKLRYKTTILAHPQASRKQQLGNIIAQQIGQLVDKRVFPLKENIDNKDIRHKKQHCARYNAKGLSVYPICSKTERAFTSIRVMDAA